MPLHKLSKGAIRKIHAAIDTLYDRAKARIIGPKALPKGIQMRIRHELTLPALFEAATAQEGHKADQDTLEALSRIADSYIEAARDRTKAQSVNAISHILRSASAGGVQTDLRTVLDGELSKVWDTATTTLSAIVDTEASNVKNVGIMDGILKTNAYQGVEDPVVFFVIVRDNVTCEECIRLHMMEDGITPRVWRLSEVGHGYHKKGDPNPKIGGLHPNCRCVLSSLLPGFGFDYTGHVTYKGNGWSELEAQRNVAKSEKPLTKMATSRTLEEGLWDKIRQHVLTNKSTYNDQYPANHPGTEMHGLIQNARLAIHTPIVNIPKLTESGRFRTQFETGTSRGTFNPQYRASAEKRLFGIPEDAHSDFRPVYGALHLSHKDSAAPRKDWHRGPASYYGSVWFELHDHVKDRSTFTGEDSLNVGEYHVYTHDKAASHISHDPRYSPYLEAQIHGGVYLDKDVKAVHARDVAGRDMTEKEVSHLKALGERYNIPVFAHQSDENTAIYKSTHIIHQPSDLFKSEPLAKSTPAGLKHLPGIIATSESNLKNMREKASRSQVAPKELVDHLDGSPTCIHVPLSRLEQISETGRFKNLFETGTGMGSTNKFDRAEWERNCFGFKAVWGGNILAHPPEERPIYGALHVHHAHPFLEGNGPADQYGAAWVKLKPHVRERTTFTYEDSSSCDSGDVYHGSHLEGLAHALVNSRYSGVSQEDLESFKKTGTFYSESHGFNYIEAQIHGGVTPDDIHEINYPCQYGEDKAPDSVYGFAKKHGIRLIEHKRSDAAPTGKVKTVAYEPAVTEPLAKSTPAGLKHLPSIIARSQANAAHKDNKLDGPLDEMTQKFMEHLKEAPIAIHVPELSYPNIAKSGRLKNLFEVGTGQGSTNKFRRATWEETCFGFSPEASKIPDPDPDSFFAPQYAFTHPPEERPIYGALYVNHKATPHEGPAPSYGRTWVILKPHVRERTTFTPVDSAGCQMHEMFHSSHMEGLVGHLSKDKYTFDSACHNIAKDTGVGTSYRAFNYIEAQIHGGVTPDDIHEIHLATHADERVPDEVLNFARANKINVVQHKKHATNYNKYDTVVHDHSTPQVSEVA